MNLSRKDPPNIDELKQHFPIRPGVIITYGNTVYLPGAGKLHLSEALREHEQVHIDQQRKAGGPAMWWRRYIDDPEFRYQQELEAHIVEYRWYIENEPERRRRRFHLRSIACRLSGPLYGLGRRREQVRTAIVKGAREL